MSNNVGKEESIVVNVDDNVTSVTKSDVGMGVEEKSVELPHTSKRKTSSNKAKTVADVANEKRIVELQKALEKLNHSFENAVADNERLSDELDSSISDNKSLRKELSKLKQDYKKAQGDNRANNALIETLNGELTRQKTRNKELLDSVSNLQGTIRNDSTKMSLLQKKNDLLHSKLQEIEGMGFAKRLLFLFTKSIG